MSEWPWKFSEPWAAADVSEEVIDLGAMIWALVVGGITIVFAVFAILHATPNMVLAMNTTKTPNPITYMFTATIGVTSAKNPFWG